MIKQLVAMFALSLFLCLILQYQALEISHTGSFSYIVGFVFGYAITLVLASLIIALIPRGFYWVLRKKKAPELIILTWSIWILLVIALTISQSPISLIHSDINQSSNNINTSNEPIAKNIYHKVSGSIYTINSNSKSQKDKIVTGGAVAVTTDFLATNCHIINDGDHFTVSINNTEKVGKLYSQHGDLCIISVPDEKFIPVEMRPSKDVEIGEDVFAIGNPEGFNKSISNGIISNKYDMHGLTMLQTNAAISPGSSGGGLFDQTGKLIGITFLTWDRTNAQNLNFVIPTEMIEAAILEPVVNNQESTTTEETQNNNSDTTSPQQSNEKITNSDIKLLGTYGKDEISLITWQGICLVTIPGRYQPNKITSLAIWIPTTPNGLYIFSRVIHVINAIKFFNLFDKTKNIKYLDSKSFMFFNNELIPLLIISFNDVNQPVYIYSTKKAITEDLISLDHFIVQFYDYSQQGGMTSIMFGLDGFTEALDAYNKNCNK